MSPKRVWCPLLGRRAGGVEIQDVCFPWLHGTDLKPPGVLMLVRASEPQIFSVPEPLHDSANGHPTVFRSPGGFRPVPDNAKEGRCLDSSFSSTLTQQQGDQTRLNRSFLSNRFLNMLLSRACSPRSCIHMEAKRIKASALPRVDRNGSETRRPNVGRVTVRGVAEGSQTDKI